MRARSPTLYGDISLFCAWVKIPTTLRLGAIVLTVAIVVLAAPTWLPLFGTVLAVEDSLQTADAALVLEGTGTEAMDAVEAWRRQGTVRDVVVIEAPIKTHALVAYWTDFVSWGLAPVAPTPPDHLRFARSPSTQAAEQARAALPFMQALESRSAL